jgi:superfamily II DNA/RNA helicase
MVAEADIERPGFRLLVLTNSRERASEIAEMANKISDIWGEQNLQARVVIGGTSYQKEIDFLDFKEPEVIVATPGRLLQHLPNSDYFRNLKVLVVDNAEYFTTTDQTQLDAILKDLSKNRKTIIVGDERLTTDVEPKWFGLETASENVKIVESKSRPNRQTKHVR